MTRSHLREASDSAAITLSVLIPPVFCVLCAVLLLYVSEGLFMSVPSIRRQFKSDVSVQGKRMVDVMMSLMLRMAVAARTGPASAEYAQLQSQCRAFVDRHLDYGVTINQYNLVGEALFHSLHMCIGDEGFTDATRAAWIRLYSFVLQQVSGLFDELRKLRPIPKDVSKKQYSKNSRTPGSYEGDASPSAAGKCPFSLPPPSSAAPSPASASNPSSCPMHSKLASLTLPAQAVTSPSVAASTPTIMPHSPSGSTALAYPQMHAPGQTQD